MYIYTNENIHIKKNVCHSRPAVKHVCSCARPGGMRLRTGIRRVAFERPPACQIRTPSGSRRRTSRRSELSLLLLGHGKPTFRNLLPVESGASFRVPPKKWRAFPLVCSVIFWPPRGSRRATRRLPTKNGGHCPLFLDLFCGLPDAVMFGTRNAVKKNN